jgi:hypothetical protein
VLLLHDPVHLGQRVNVVVKDGELGAVEFSEEGDGLDGRPHLEELWRVEDEGPDDEAGDVHLEVLGRDETVRAELAEEADPDVALKTKM